ncbi:MAG: hypothetical protein KDA44_06750 [Planctomycetales bacterium]|nr:hypothetical protein [Planctomycetales bacterium]
MSLGLCAQQTLGGVLFTTLDMDGEVDTFQDDSRSIYTGPGSAFAPAVGGVISGFLQITIADGIGPSTPAPPSIIAIFSFKIATNDANGDLTTGDFGLVPVGSAAFKALAPTLTAASGLTDPELDKAMFIVASKATPQGYVTPADSAATALGYISTLDADATLSYDLTAGFDGPNDFLTATQIGSIFAEEGLFSVLGDSYAGTPGPGAGYIPVSLFPGGPTSDIALSGFVRGNTAPGSTFVYADDVTLIANIVPEAGSVLVWTLMAACGTLVGYRGRRAA